MTVRLAVSATAEQAAALTENGPRRDFIELANRTNAEVLFQSRAAGRGGLAAKLFGPHLAQAWTLARRTRSGDRLFADGEHIGLPLLLLLAFRRRSQPASVVVLGHFLTRWWKLLLVWIATRIGPPGVLVLHSTAQAERVRRWLGGRWTVELVPYLVDTAFWTRTSPLPVPVGDEPPLVLAVGSENRDYETLVRAARGLHAHVFIAAGSHWARRIAGSGSLPDNVEYSGEARSFAELRSLYEAASVVVVPLADVPNQSGVTTILEALSMGTPVIVTATEGQREYVAGPLVTTRFVDAAGTEDRGPHLFDATEPAGEMTGLYVPPRDSLALRHAIERVLLDTGLARQLGEAARRSAVAHFDIERYTARLASLLQPAPQSVIPPETAVTA